MTTWKEGDLIEIADPLQKIKADCQLALICNRTPGIGYAGNDSMFRKFAKRKWPWSIGGE